MLGRMVRLTVETGAITALGAAAELASFWAVDHDNVHFVL